MAASRWAIVWRESARSHGGEHESVGCNCAFLGTTTNRLLWISEERFRRLCARLVKIYEDLAQIYRRQEGYDNNRWIDGGERVSLYHRATRSQQPLSIDRSFLFFPFVREARRGERRRCEARRSEATRSGGYSTRRGAPLSTALIRIRAPVRRAFSRKSIRRVRFSDFDRCCWRNARKSWNVALRRNATITDGSFCFLFSSKSS